MNHISIPPTSIKHKDLVAVPRALYDEFVHWQMLQRKEKAAWVRIERAARDVAAGKGVAHITKTPGESSAFLQKLIRQRRK